MKRASRLISIEIDESNFKIGWFDVRKQIVHALEWVNLKDASDSDKSKRLAGFFKKKALRARRTSSILVIGRHQTTVRLVRFPTSDDVEIERMAGFQAVRQTPFSREEVVVDYEKIAIDPKGYAVVMLAVVPREIIQRSLDILEGAGVIPEKAILSSQALANLYLDNRVTKDLLETKCFIDMDCVRTSMEVMHQGKLLFTRSMAVGSHDLEGSSQGLDMLVREMRATLRAYEGQDPAPAIQNIVFTRSTPGLFELMSYVEKTLHITCVKRDVLECLKWDKSFKEVFHDQEVQASFTTLIGAVVKNKSHTIDLLPEEWRARRYQRGFRRQLVIAAGMVLGIFLSLGVLGFSRVSNHREYLSFLDSHLLMAKPQSQRLKALSKQLSVMEKALVDQYACLNALTEIYHIIPNGVQLTLFAFEEGDRIYIRGTTPDLAQVFKTRDVLETSLFFEKVEVKFATRKRLREGEVTDFQIECPLKMQ